VRYLFKPKDILRRTTRDVWLQSAPYSRIRCDRIVRRGVSWYAQQYTYRRKLRQELIEGGGVSWRRYELMMTGSNLYIRDYIL